MLINYDNSIQPLINLKVNLEREREMEEKHSILNFINTSNKSILLFVNY